jgi:hypothetical protein
MLRAMCYVLCMLHALRACCVLRAACYVLRAKTTCSLIVRVLLNVLHVLHVPRHVLLGCAWAKEDYWASGLRTLGLQTTGLPGPRPEDWSLGLGLELQTWATRLLGLGWAWSYWAWATGLSYRPQATELQTTDYRATGLRLQATRLQAWSYRLPKTTGLQATGWLQAAGLELPGV